MKISLQKRDCVVLLLLLGSMVFASTHMSDFHARRESNAVILEWTTENESNLSKFDIERSTDRFHWIKIGETAAAGESSSRQNYSYKDNTIFKTAINNFYYRLILVNKDGQAVIYDVIVSASGSSGIQHTWGSIKAMFR